MPSINQFRGNKCYLSILALGMSLVFSVSSGATESTSSSPEASSPPAKPSGILPLPDYSGSFTKRAYLMGDFDGKRDEWAEKGVTFNVDTYQYLQSVVDGGAETATRYGGVINWNLAVDFNRMGHPKGGLLQIQAKSRYGSSVNGISGSAIPVNSNATTPSTSVLDQNVVLYLPVINYTHFFSQKLGMLVGKINTYPQTTEFIGGSGESQFFNLNLVAPVSPALIVPYSSLVAGALIMPVPGLLIELAVGTSTDTSNNTGFSHIDDGKFFLAKFIYQYELSKLPGGFTNQTGYGWDNDFTELNGRFVPGIGGLEPSTKGSTWMNSFDFWQYLYVEDGEEQTVDINNGRQDRQGVGIWSRIQVADSDTNPMDYSWAVGFSARGLFRNRDNDTMGIGYEKTKIERLRLGDLLGIGRKSWVWEAYYNFELTPAIYLTLDAQLAKGAFTDYKKATILGTQLQLRF